MRIYTKFNVSQFEGFDVPTFNKLQTADIRCAHCHRITRTIIQEDHVDWKIVADFHKELYERSIKWTDQMIKDIDAMGTGSNPIRQHIHNSWAALAINIRKMIEDIGKNGTE